MIKEKYLFEKKVFSRKGYKFKFEADDELINEILEYKKSGSVLELGCGEGGTALELAKRGFEVTCVDISKTAINKIKEKAKKDNIKIDAICADLENYSIEKKYDVIFGGGFIHFLPEDKALKLIEECKKNTKNNGIDVFEVLLGGDCSQEDDSEGYYFPSLKLKEVYSDWKIEGYEEYEDYDSEEKGNNKIAFLVAVKK